MADQSQDAVYGFAEDSPKPAGGPPALPSHRRRRPPNAPPPAASPPAGAPEAKAKRRREIVALVVIVGICVTVAVFMAVRQNVQESAEQSAFQSAIDDYLFSPLQPEPGVPRPRAGKVVLIDMDKRAFDRLHLNLNEDLRAHTPAEVATIAQMRYTRQQVGRFEMGARAIQPSCTMTLVDRASRTVIATRSFVWGPPPTRIPRGGDREDVTGPPPLQEITNFLATLR